MLSVTSHTKDSASTSSAFLLCHNAVCYTFCSYSVSKVNHTVSSRLRILYTRVHSALLSAWYLPSLLKPARLRFRLPFTAQLSYTHLHLARFHLPGRSTARLWLDTWAANHGSPPHLSFSVSVSVRCMPHCRRLRFRYMVRVLISVFQNFTALNCKVNRELSWQITFFCPAHR